MSETRGTRRRRKGQSVCFISLTSPRTEGSNITSEFERLIDFGQEVPRRERLGQVEVCPGGESEVDVGLLGRSREQNHLGPSEFGFRSDRVQDVQPCSSRHPNIEQYERGTIRLYQRPSLIAVRGLDKVVIVTTEGFNDQEANTCLVIGHDDRSSTIVRFRQNAIYSVGWFG